MFKEYIFDCNDELKIQVFRARGDLAPHFHVLKDGEQIASILISDNKYYMDTETILSDELCKTIDDWMDQPNTKWVNSNLSNWQAVVSAWNFSIEGRRIDKDNGRPDFTSINIA